MAMSDYCVIAQHVLKQNPPPYKKLIVDVWEIPEYAGVVFLRLYAQNLADFSDNQIAGITEWLNKVKGLLNEHPLIVAKWAHVIAERNPDV
jgi:hypothetical protein